MEKLKKICNRILFPGIPVVMISIPIATTLLLYTFLEAGEESLISYVAYCVSAYSLVIVCVVAFPAMRRGYRRIRQNPQLSRYFEDIPFKLRISLHVSFGANLLYAVINGVSGIYYHSVWFGTLAAYYILLSMMRYWLVRYTHKTSFGENQEAEWKWYRLCGVILILMNMTLTGVIILVLHQNRSFSYAGFLIYGIALYTFWITILSVVNLIRYRKRNSPAMSAARMVNVTAALVSMLSLEIAMLTQFDNGTNAPYFRQTMVGFTGGAVCMIVIGLGVSMVMRGSREIRGAKRSQTAVGQDEEENVFLGTRKDDRNGKEEHFSIYLFCGTAERD